MTLADRCVQCGNIIFNKEVYIVYKLVVVTNVKAYFIGLIKLLEDLSNYAMSRRFHLSSSQILLLRPDVMKKFLNQKFYPERTIYWFLDEYELCDKCFSEYAKLVPLI